MVGEKGGKEGGMDSRSTEVAVPNAHSRLMHIVGGSRMASGANAPCRVVRLWILLRGGGGCGGLDGSISLLAGYRGPSVFTNRRYRAPFAILEPHFSNLVRPEV